MNRKEKALEFVNDVYDIQITGRHVAVTEPMKDYAMEKISKIERFMNRILDVNVIMDVQKFEHRIEIIMKVGNLLLTSQATTKDMYASIDKAVHKLEAQILRYKSKLNDHHKPLDMKVDVMAPPSWEEAEEDFEEYSSKTPADEFKPHKIVKQETRPLKILRYNEAVVKMELSGDSFMLFKSEDDQKLKVIYRRDDGNYGIIEPNC
jgi:putative sigma-54 modulation protein